MINRLHSDIFWGNYSPLSALTGAGLMIMASSRLAFAIFCTGALLWTYCLTALAYYSGKKIMPKKGKFIILLFLSSFICSVYLLIISFLNPLLVSITWFFVVLVPPCCIGSGLFENLGTQDMGEIITRVSQEAASLGLVIIAISLIREPIGFGSLSFPGGVWGIVEIFSSKEGGEGFFPIRLLSASAGGLLILGFGVAVYRYFRSQHSVPGDDL